MNARYLIPLAVITILISIGCEPKHGNGVWWNGGYQDILQKYPFIRANPNGDRLTYKCDKDEVLPAPAYYHYDLTQFGLTGFLKTANDRSCEDLKVHENRLIQTFSGDLTRETPVQAAYRIERTDADNYRITIPILFAPTCESAEFKNKDIVAAWAKRIQGCFDDADPYLQGPGGSHLHLRLETVDSATSVQAYHSVQVYPLEKEFRENAGLLSPSSSCSTLLHESLHWLGMVDEYHVQNGVDHVTDMVTGKASTFDCGCRSLGPDDSIMNSPFMAWISTVESKDHPLLYPAEANGILYPGCAAKNSNFYQCAQYAYTSTCEAGKVPAMCRDASWVK